MLLLFSEKLYIQSNVRVAAEMPTSEASAVIEDEKEESWAWEENCPSKLCLISEKVIGNFLWESNGSWEKQVFLGDVNAKADFDNEIVNEEENIKDSKG